MGAYAVPMFTPWAALVAAWAALAQWARELSIFREGEGEGGAGAGGEGGAGGAAGGAGGEGGESDEDKTFTEAHADLVKDYGLKAARQIVKDRDQAATERRARTAAERKLKDAEDAKLSESERATKQQQDSEKAIAAANTRIINAEIKVAASAAGAHDPDAVLALIDREGIEIDDEGSVSGVKSALDLLLKAKPYLKGTPGAGRSGGEGGGGAGERPGTGSRMNDQIRRAVGLGS